MNKAEKKYIVFFDLDHTLLRVNSGVFLIRRAYKRKMLSLRDLSRSVFFAILFKYDLMDTKKIIIRMGKWLSGLPEKEVRELISDVFVNDLLSRIRPGMVEVLEQHRKNGAELVLLSSSMIELCELFGSHFKMDHVIGTHLSIRNGFFTGFPKNDFCFGTEKQKQILDYCKIRDFNISEAWHYADSISDLEALEITGHPVCVSPDRKLRQEALKRNWPILE